MKERILILSISYLLLFTMACSTSIKKAEIPPTASPAVEIDRIRQELIVARDKDQADVLSPDLYSESFKYLRNAENALKEQRSDSNKVMDALAYSQGALEQARVVTKQANAIIPEVIEARKRAVDAEAVKYQPDQLRKTDRDLTGITHAFEEGNLSVRQKDRLDLESAYFRIEQTAVTAARLNRARNIYQFAKRNDAERLTPKNFSDFAARIREAELKIGASLRDKNTLLLIEEDINKKADHLLRVLQTVHQAKNQPMEVYAVGRIQEQDALAQAQMSLKETEETLADTQEDLVETEIRTTEMEANQRLNKALHLAQSKLSNDEAEISLQGNKLVMRLKSLHFPFGTSNLTPKSIEVLRKVTEVLARLPSEKEITIQGHTDSVGSPEVNQKLSQARAEVVSKFLISQDIVPKNQITAEGASYDRPIASNRKSMGRSENRRVDIFVTPSMDRKTTEQTGKETL